MMILANTGWTFVAARVADGIQIDSASISATRVERINTAAAGATPVLSKTDFRVTLSLNHADAPLILTLAVNADQVYGLGTPFRVVDNVPQLPVLW